MYISLARRWPLTLGTVETECLLMSRNSTTFVRLVLETKLVLLLIHHQQSRAKLVFSMDDLSILPYHSSYILKTGASQIFPRDTRILSK
jgi:hypothetical protein